MQLCCVSRRHGAVRISRMACVAVPTQNHSSHRRQPFQRSALQIGIKMSNILKECSASAGIQEEEEEEA